MGGEGCGAKHSAPAEKCQTRKPASASADGRAQEPDCALDVLGQRLREKTQEARGQGSA